MRKKKFQRNKNNSRRSLPSSLPSSSPSTSILYRPYVWLLGCILVLILNAFLLLSTTSNVITIDSYYTTEADFLQRARDGFSNTDANANRVVVARRTQQQQDLLPPQQQQQHQHQHQHHAHCKRAELLTIRGQLHLETCTSARLRPWRQFCGITVNTKCVDAANWLDDYYAEIYHHNAGNVDAGNVGVDKVARDQHTQIPSHHRDLERQPFLGISVGCNKGFDALNTLRMGRFDASLNKESWNNAMSEGEELYISVCAQNDANDQFPLPPPLPSSSSNSSSKSKRSSIRSSSRSDTTNRSGEMHCFEPMPQTVRKLEASAKQLGYDKLGFRVVPKAVSNKPGTTKFLTNTKAGIENIGIENKCSGGECQDVEVVALGGYVKNVIDKEHNNNNNNNNNPPPIIHHLSIDVEGYDADVLLGAGPDVLKRVEYLEFEYNYMGSWGRQHLHDVITMLDGKDHRPIFHDDQDSNSNINSNNGDGDKTANNYGDLSFTCYWAGKQKLWRITDCWLHAYDLHVWGNVACVNRKLAPMLAAKMEAVFQNTLLLDKNNDGFDTVDLGRSHNWSNDPMLRIDPHESFVSTEYLAKWNDRSKQK